MPSPHRSAGLPSSLGDLAGAAGKALLTGALNRMSREPRVLLAVGEFMYRAEVLSGGPWEKVPDEGKRVWTGRASDAILGLREYLRAKPDTSKESP